MFKFFRRLRQRLLQEGSFRKYLLYAVGEIILVVIGILLALQINTLKEERNAAKERAELISALKKDFDENQKRLKNTIRFQKEIIKNSGILIKLISAKNKQGIGIDSILGLKKYAGFIGFRVKLVNSTFEAMISSGKINLLKNQELKNTLFQLSTDLAAGFEDDEESKEYFTRMYDSIEEYDFDLIGQQGKRYFGLSASEDDFENATQKLINNDRYLSNLINKTTVEIDRLKYQEQLLAEVETIIELLKQNPS